MEHRSLWLWNYDVRDIPQRHSALSANLRHLGRCGNMGCCKPLNGGHFLTHAWSTKAKGKASSLLLPRVHEDGMPGSNDCTSPLRHSPFTVYVQTRRWSWESIRATPIVQQNKWFSPKRIASLWSIFPSLQVLEHLSDGMYETHIILEYKLLWYELWHFLKKIFCDISTN